MTFFTRKCDITRLTKPCEVLFDFVGEDVNNVQKLIIKKTIFQIVICIIIVITIVVCYDGLVIIAIFILSKLKIIGNHIFQKFRNCFHHIRNKFREQ